MIHGIEKENGHIRTLLDPNNTKASMIYGNTMTSGKYFNRAVMSLDSPHIGHIVRETDDKIVVFRGGKERYDIPLSEIQTTARNVLIGVNLDDIVKKYKVSREAPLPTHRKIP